MPIADAKKVQTAINVVGLQVEAMRSAMATINIVRAAYATQNPDATGTPLEGNVDTMNSALSALEAELDSAIFTQLIAAVVPSHRNAALT